VKSVRKYGCEVRDFLFYRCLFLATRVDVATAGLERVFQLDFESIERVVDNVGMENFFLQACE
jgi:hypothetical protein